MSNSEKDAAKDAKPPVDASLYPDAAAIIQRKLVYRYHQHLVTKMLEASGKKAQTVFFESECEALVAAAKPGCGCDITVREAMRRAMVWHSNRYMTQLMQDGVPTLAKETGAVLDDLIQSHFEGRHGIVFFQDPTFDMELCQAVAEKAKFMDDPETSRSLSNVLAQLRTDPNLQVRVQKMKELADRASKESEAAQSIQGPTTLN